MISLAYYDSPLGRITIAAKEEKICGAWFEGQKYFLSSLKEQQTQEKLTPVLEQAQGWLDHYFLGEDIEMDLPLLAEGTSFQKTVWEVLQTIPYGNTMTYGEVSREVSRLLGRDKMSAQAVGQAVGHNPISILIPCHRVLGKSGSLIGYAGGIGRKKSLLEMEGSI